MNIEGKTRLCRALSATGLLALGELLLQGRGGVVFMLHRVLPRGEQQGFYNPYLVLDERVFDAFLGFLVERGSVLPLDELLRRVRAGASAVNCCALTFDDGWEDNYRVAWPLMRKHSVPATIFLPTRFVGSTELLPEDRLWQLWRKSASAGEWQRFNEAFAAWLPPAAGATLPGFAAYRGCLKALPLHQRTDLFQELERRFGPPRANGSAFMSWNNANEMATGGISFGSHTVHHVSLACEQLAVMKTELAESKRIVEEKLGRAAPYLAYPSGILNAAAAGLAAEVGYEAAFTTQLGTVSGGSDMLQLKRVAIDNFTLNAPDGSFSAPRARLHLLRARSA